MSPDISIESSPDISKDTDEIHTAEMTFTYKTHIFGGTEQGDLKLVNPFIAPITKISAEVHAVPFLDPDAGDVKKNDTGKLGSGDQDLGGVNSMSPENYLNKVDEGKIAYPEYEMIDWILDYEKNPETGELEPVTDPNQPFGYVVEDGDGLTWVTPKHRLYDQEVEITPDHMKQLIQSQNYVNQWGLPYQPIETRPWNDIGIISEVTEEDLQE